MKTKKILLLVTLVVVLVGVVSASEVSDDTINANTHDTEDMLVQELAPATAEIQESVTSEAKENKEIQKEEKTIKTISIIAWDTGDIGVVNPNANANGYSAGSAGSVANFVGPGNADTQNTNSHNGTTTDSNSNGENSGNSNSGDSKNNIFDLGIVNTKTYTVNDFDTLHNALTSDTYSTVTVNIKSNIKLTCYTELSQAIKTLTINGNGKTINGNNSYQFLTIDSDSTVTIKNIKIINCYTEEDGGAIHNEQGTLTITNSTLNNNTADYGGAISNYAILTINNSTLNNNTADYGGAISNTAKLEINNSTLNNNTVTYAGGAIVNLAALTINNSTLNNNTADCGGAIENDANPFGGAMSTYGTLTINNSTLNNNTATYAGGAIENNATLTINNSTLNNNTADHGGAISNTAKLEINNSQFKYNIAEFGNGGAIENNAILTINNSTLNNNTATYTGGAIYNRDNANMTMNNTTLNNNTANCGGAISNYAVLTINNSTLNNNYAYDWGGAVYNNATLTINNSTLNNNKADYGGAIFNRVNITINSCTLNYNKAEDNGGAIYIESTGYLYIQNNTLKYSINIENNTFSKNNAENGAGIYVYSDEYDCKELKTRWVEGHYESGSYYDIYGVEVHYNKWVEGHYEEYYVPISNISNPFIKIQKNIFRQNKANTTGKAIIKYKNATISNNTNAETSKYSGTIYINWPNVQIKNNIFYDEIIYTKTITSAVNGIIGEKLTLKATVTDTYNNKVNEGNLIFKLNGITIKDNGKLTGSSNPLIAKVTNGVATATITPDLNMRSIKKLTAHYTGTDSYNASVSVPVTSQISQRNASIVVTSNVKTIKQGQVLTLTAKIYDTTNGKKSTDLTKYADEFVYFKVNGITLKDSNGKMLKVKIINGTATTKYTIPLGLSGVTDGKTMTPKNHTILVGFYNKNYQENIRNTSTFQVERSNITITIANVTVNNKTHKLSLTATIKDYLGNIVAGPNKCVIKINGMSLKNGTQAMYYYSTNGILNIKDINIPAYNNYKTIEIVTQDRLAYKSQRNTTTNIKVENKNVKTATVEKNVERNIKTASKTYDVNDFNTLHSALTSDTYDTVTVNIKSNIILTDNTRLNERISKLTINGNGKTIDGQNNYQFLKIDNNSVTLKNLKIINCIAINGGAIYNEFGGELTIYNSTFNNNSADFGGAIYNDEYGTITIRNSTLTNNTAFYGGAIYNHENGTLTIHNSTFNNNTATTSGGAIYNHENGTLTIHNSTFNNNTATTSGGAIYNHENGTLTIHNSTFNNTANYGGAIYNDGILNIFSTTLTVNNTTTEAETSTNTTTEPQTPTNTNTTTEPETTNNTTQPETTNNTNTTTEPQTPTNTNTTTEAETTNNTTQPETTNNTNTTTEPQPQTNTKTVVSTVYAIIGNPMTLTAQVTDTNNKPVNKGYVIFKLNSITIKDNKKLTGSNNPLKVYVSNGVASTTVTADINMRYAQNLTAVYSGSSTYNASRSNNAKAQISQRNASIVVKSNVKTIKQGQTLTITARVYDTTGGKRSTSLIPYEDEFVYFKVNGITLKDSKGNMQKVKVVNGTATIKYTIPLGLSGVTDGKTFNVKNHTILAGYYNKNYQAEVRNTSTFQVERSNITITIANVTVNNKTHKLSLTATIKDYLGNIVAGPNKCVIKINGISLKNGTQAMYYYSTNGILNIKDINIPAYNNYKTIEIVTQDRLAYKSQRNTTTVIKVTN